MRIASERAGREVVSSQRRAVVVVEEATPVVLRDAPLAPVLGRLLQPGAVTQSIALVRFGAVDPVVGGHEQPVRLMLGIATHGVEGVDERDPPGYVVPVLHEKEVGGFGHEDASGVDGDRSGENEAVQKDRRGLIRTVRVEITEHHNAPHGFIFSGAVQRGHVAAHLDDPHRAVFVEHECDRIHHVRLGRNQLDFEARLDLEVSERFVGRKNRGRRDAVGMHHIYVLVGIAGLCDGVRFGCVAGQHDNGHPRGTHQPILEPRDGMRPHQSISV